MSIDQSGGDKIQAAASVASEGASASSETWDGFFRSAGHMRFARDSGGIRFLSNTAGTTGATLAPGASAWAAVSDRATKENIEELNPATVLAAVAALPVYQYNYIGTDPSLVCRGPMAQDWHAAFPSAKDPLTIDTMDLDGITLAAVKGLAILAAAHSEQMEELQEQIEELRQALKR